ncbi:MAG: hypothetical protein MUC31_08650, partial [Bacteroidales bacterium]|nr:hypothetical protein [Bacteroidales bacterium]
MKKTLLIILNVLIYQLLTGQTGNNASLAGDPFCEMVKTLWHCDALSFRSQYTEKELFETGTVTTYARVTVKKTGRDLTFLHIVPENDSQELLFCMDSAWLVTHEEKKLSLIGTGTGNLDHYILSHFFPFTLYNIDTAISSVVPFWTVIQQTEDFTVFSLNNINAPKEVSDVRVEFTIRNADLLPHKTYQESVYMKMDRTSLEQVFTEYSLPAPESVL